MQQPAGVQAAKLAGQVVEMVRRRRVALMPYSLRCGDGRPALIV